MWNVYANIFSSGEKWKSMIKTWSEGFGKKLVQQVATSTFIIILNDITKIFSLMENNALVNVIWSQSEIQEMDEK